VAAASATTASTTLSCQSVTITPASGSICKSASGSICSTSAGAAAIQTAVTAAWSALTSAVVTASGTAACTAIGGTAVSSFWTNPSTWGCDGKNPDPCNAATCGTTATAAPATTALPYCCDSIRNYINGACSGITNLATLITPTGLGNGTSVILSTLGVPGVCADTNCQKYSGPAGSASTVAYSVLAALVAALLALVNF
jgi:hypothetical protein